MSAQEILLHARKKVRQKVDAARPLNFAFDARPDPDAFPSIPQGAPPESLLAALREEVAEIVSGRIRAFNTLQLDIDLPPKWHKDYLAGVDLSTMESAFALNHRALPNGADVKLIWELSRWNFLVRLAQAAALLKDERAGALLVECLRDWEKVNPPYRGWNWTSALESGMRLIQFAWMDALMERAGAERTLGEEFQQMLGAHAHFTWRYKTFGSSANNHLLGELVGLIVAVARWPGLVNYAAPLEELQRLWETEVLAQFAEDGGNREQALNYHLFSFEFCWQARLGLLAAGRKVSASVEERLRRAGDFFQAVQTEHEPWDYGDSDSAYVTPLFADQARVTQQWLGWFRGQTEGESLRWWLGEPPEPTSKQSVSRGDWVYFPRTGVAIIEKGGWRGRWDLSELGYLATAAHGHLDALHLSLWLNGKAIVIDPGTGAYYGNKFVRERLAGWRAHNGPLPPWGEWPRRLGPFLWGEQHDAPDFDGTEARLRWPSGVVKRRITFAGDSVMVEDSVDGPSAGFEVNWQFGAGALVTQVGARQFHVQREAVSLSVEVDAGWSQVKLLPPPPEAATWEIMRIGPAAERERLVETLCSPAFRQLAHGPKLLLSYTGLKPCVLRTSFLTSLE